MAKPDESHITPENALKLLHKLAESASKLSQWERDFCYDMTHHLDCGGKPSPKQYAKLKDLQAKYFGS